MEKGIRWKLAMAARVLDFARAHPSDDGSYNTLVSRLEDRVKRADALALQQRDGKSLENAAVTRRTELRADVLRLQMQHLVKAAELALPDHPELAGQFVLPPAGGTLKAFIVAAKSLLAAALPQKDLFLQLGVGDTFLDEFSQGVADFDASTQTAHSHHGERVGARADLKAVTAECVKLTAVLHGTFRTRFRKDPETLAAWESARIVYRPRKTKQETEPVPPPVPLLARVAVEPPKPAADDKDDKAV